jgi:hypothetical protein
MNEDINDLTLIKKERERLKIKSDTLFVRLSFYKATLYQIKQASFTARDTYLKNFIFKIYSKSSSFTFIGAPYIEPKCMCLDGILWFSSG